MRDLHRAFQEISGVRVGEQFAAQRLRDVYGFQNRYAETIANRQDLAWLKSVQRRFADDVGYKLKKPLVTDRPERNTLSVWKEPLDEALMIGDLNTAKQIVRDARKGMSPKRWEMEVKGLKAHLRARQPIQALTKSEASRTEFIRWAKENLSPYEIETLRRLDETYRRSAQRLGIGLEFKAPELEDVMKFRERIKLRLEPTAYQPSE